MTMKKKYITHFKIKHRLPDHIQNVFKEQVKPLMEEDTCAIYRVEAVVEGTYLIAYGFKIKKPKRIGKKLRITSGLEIRVRNVKGKLQLTPSTYLKGRVTKESQGEKYIDCFVDDDCFVIEIAEKKKTP